MKNVFIFVTGAAIGGVVTWKLVEKYYKDLADEEIASVVETFKNREKEFKNIEENNETEIVDNKKDKAENKTIINSENYGEVNIEEAEEKLINDEPVIEREDKVAFEIISPDEFGELDDYVTKSWIYWADNVLTDDLDNVIEDPSDTVGDALSHFGEYEEDSVYVRNNANQTDYEIIKSERDFEEF